MSYKGKALRPFTTGDSMPVKPVDMPDNACPCGSTFERRALSDARGIFCCYVCDLCEAGKRKQYRQDVLDDPNAAVDEQIEAQ